MGFSICWYAIRESGAQELLERLCLSPSGETEEFPESLISTARLDTGWRILWYNEYECPFLRPEDLRVVAKDQEVMMCRVEEHVMASSAEVWCRGKRKWRIAHVGEEDARGLSAEGDLPECFAAIRRELEEARCGAGGNVAGFDHVFDVPLEVAKMLVGFRHDEICPHLSGERFVVQSRRPPRRGLIARLFGA